MVFIIHIVLSVQLHYFSLNDRTSTRLIRVQERTTDLEKIALTNSLSRKISNKELTIDD